MHRQIPARYYAFACRAEEIYLRNEKFNVDTLIQETNLMRKKNFFQYRWMMYWHELDQKSFHAKLAASENPMEFKDSPQKVKEIIQAILLERSKSKKKSTKASKATP